MIRKGTPRRAKIPSLEVTAHALNTEDHRREGVCGARGSELRLDATDKKSNLVAAGCPGLRTGETDLTTEVQGEVVPGSDERKDPEEHESDG